MSTPFRKPCDNVSPIQRAPHKVVNLIIIVKISIIGRGFRMGSSRVQHLLSFLPDPMWKPAELLRRPGSR
jgi:hypothetical protein